MLVAVCTARDRVILLVLRDTGCRVSEIAGLKLAKVDLNKGLVFVRVKGGAERFTFLSAVTVAALRAYLRERASVECDALFLSKQRTAITSAAVGLVLRRIARRANVQGRSNPHSLRHAFARDWLMSGGDLASLADVLGHVDIQTTKVYASFETKELQELHRQHGPLAMR